MRIALTELQPYLRLITISFARQQSLKGKLAQVDSQNKGKDIIRYFFSFFSFECLVHRAMLSTNQMTS